MTPHTIHTINWSPFITRPASVFLAITPMYDFESKRMHKVLGWGYKNMCIFSDGKVIRSFVDEDYRQQGFTWLAQEIDTNPQRIIALLEIAVGKEKALQDFMYNADTFFASVTKKNLAEKYKKFTVALFDYMLYPVSIAFFILGAHDVLEREVQNKQALETIQTKASEFRKESLYPIFIETMLPRMEESIATHHNIDQATLARILPEEMHDFLRTGDITKIQAIAEQRKNEFALLFHNFESIPVTHKEVIQKFLVTSEKTSKITGAVACQGNITGTARIVIDSSDFAKFNQGDILVTINSNPSLMPVISKAAAIVSDEGGMSCHAAIVSRELGIPCVIGTKIGTQHIKDGDTMEVDAVNGVVRKI